MLLALALRCALAVIAAAATVATDVASTAAANATSYCAALEREAGAAGAVRRSAAVALVWGAEPARAAAALLRAALLAGGHRGARVALVRHAPAARLCALLARPPPAAAAVLLAPATAWAPGDGCALGGRELRVQGAAAAPAAAELRARLARPAPACARAAAAWPFYEDEAALRACGFLPPPGNETGENATVYILEGEWERETEELRAAVGAARLTLRRVRRPQLEELLANTTHSFLFLDAALWDGEPGVTRAPPLPDASVSLAVALEYGLAQHAPALAAALPRLPAAVRAADLRYVLHRAAELGAEEAACELLATAAPPPLLEWRRAAARPAAMSALAVVCDAAAARALRAVVERHILAATDAIGLGIVIEVVETDCADPGRLIRALLDLDCRGRVAHAVGAVAPAELASAAAPTARELRLPLLAYEPAAGAPSAAGAPGALARALRRLLAACGWRRVGVVSDGTRAAAALSAALRAGPGAPLVREASAASPARAARAVAALRAADARVFLLNAGAATAARALAAGRALGLAPEAGFAWIVRDYEAADAAAAALRPYSVSFQWRGGAAPGGERRLRAQLDALWEGGVWPRHASALVDALLTLGEGYRRLLIAHPEMRDHPRHEKKTSLLWDAIRAGNVSGVMGPLRYDESGVVAAPRVYVERWGGEPRPRLLAVWGAAEAAPRGEACLAPAPPPDGSARCLAPAGDAFRPSCRDVAWAAAAVALALAALACGAAAAAARRALARRDRRVSLRAAAQLLARREKAFAALAPHLVDRAALELREELGAGRFGRVRLGVLRAPGRERPTIVAAKALRADAAPAEESQFLREACTLAALRHDHIVRFVGVCVAGGPPLLLMEHAFFGDLLRYLRARRHLAEGAMAGEAGEAGGEAVGREEAAYVSAEALTRLAHEAASALAHLASRGLVHRDVRAANCLVDGRRSLKLADFGLARSVGVPDGEYACRSSALLPVLWMAPESLARGVATAASDAWSFGVLALELVTLGARPFGAAPPPRVVRAVLAGARPPLPRDASAETRALARACWRRAPGARPPAARLAAWLAARRRALRPALAPAPAAAEPDCDSGLGADAPDAPPL